jgi:hypothetical protein
MLTDGRGRRNEYHRIQIWLIYGMVDICDDGLSSRMKYGLLAERVGFEPTVRLHVHRISSPAHSTTLPPLQVRAWCGSRGF